MDLELRTRLLLSLQRAMWETVTPDLRGVAVALRGGDRQRIDVRFLYADGVGELQEELVALAETYLIADFNEVPDLLTTSFTAVPHASRDLDEGEEWFFLRWEAETEPSRSWHPNDQQHRTTIRTRDLSEEESWWKVELRGGVTIRMMADSTYLDGEDVVFDLAFDPQPLALVEVGRIPAKDVIAYISILDQRAE